MQRDPGTGRAPLRGSPGARRLLQLVESRPARPAAPMGGFGVLARWPPDPRAAARTAHSCASGAGDQQLAALRAATTARSSRPRRALAEHGCALYEQMWRCNPFDGPAPGGEVKDLDPRPSTASSASAQIHAAPSPSDQPPRADHRQRRGRPRRPPSGSTSSAPRRAASAGPTTATMTNQPQHPSAERRVAT